MVVEDCRVLGDMTDDDMVVLMESFITENGKVDIGRLIMTDFGDFR